MDLDFEKELLDLSEKLAHKTGAKGSELKVGH